MLIQISIDPKAVQSCRFSRRGHRYHGKRAKQYKDTLARALESERLHLQPGVWPVRVDGPVVVECEFLFHKKLKKAEWRRPKKTRPDLDNLWKPLGDALQHAGYVKDDGQIVELKLSKAYTSGPSHILLFIAPEAIT